jgi:branched-chain amino acid transport system ATP-binding protein
VNTPPAIELRDLWKSFGRTEIIRGANLSVRRGERHAIIGPNGAGKSTLFNLISGRHPVSSGRVLLNGEDVTGLTPYEINRKGLARSFQVTNIFHGLSVYENIRCAALWSLGYRYVFWRRLNALRDARARAEEVMEGIGLARRRDTVAGVLSYAEQRALEIGVTIAGGAPVVLLDEPTAGMNRTEAADAVALIRKVTGDKTLVMVEHDMSAVFGLADRISVLVYGEIIATGTPEAIRANPAVKEAYLGTSLDLAGLDQAGLDQAGLDQAGLDQAG